MGFSFRRSSSFGPFRLNFSKSGIGASIGVKGARVTLSPKGRTYITVGAGDRPCAILMVGTGCQGGLVLLNSIVDRSYPPTHRGRALGLTLSVGRLGAILGPVLVAEGAALPV